MTGPLGLSNVELTRYGLGVVIRDIRVPGALPCEPQRRLYCLLCGTAIDHEPRVDDWWICGRDCNAPATH